jgi:hypothetical protein
MIMKQTQFQRRQGIAVLAAAVIFNGVAISGTASAEQEASAPSMSFFITSSNLGGGDLGGLEGADAHCQKLAEAAGSKNQEWHAYLSTSTVDARDRIGDGPWYNAQGKLVALSVADLHYSNMSFLKSTALTEDGEVVNGAGDDPNRHDILTGTRVDGTKAADNCNDWTSATPDFKAMVGHHDRTGGGPMPTSWNASHPSRGCDMDSLLATGSNAFFYCFAK